MSREVSLDVRIGGDGFRIGPSRVNVWQTSPVCTGRVNATPGGSEIVANIHPASGDLVATIALWFGLAAWAVFWMHQSPVFVLGAVIALSAFQLVAFGLSSGSTTYAASTDAIEAWLRRVAASVE